MKEIAPGDALRDPFDHDPDKWEQFKRRYANELDGNDEIVGALRERVDEGRVTLVYAAKDRSAIWFGLSEQVPVVS